MTVSSPWTLAMSLASLTLTVTRLWADWCVWYSRKLHITPAPVSSNQSPAVVRRTNEDPRTVQPHIPAPCPASFQCCTVLRKVTVQFCPLYISARLYNHCSSHSPYTLRVFLVLLNKARMICLYQANKRYLKKTFKPPSISEQDFYSKVSVNAVTRPLLYCTCVHLFKNSVTADISCLIIFEIYKISERKTSINKFFTKNGSQIKAL